MRHRPYGPERASLAMRPAIRTSSVHDTWSWSFDVLWGSMPPTIIEGVCECSEVESEAGSLWESQGVHHPDLPAQASAHRSAAVPLAAEPMLVALPPGTQGRWHSQRRSRRSCSYPSRVTGYCQVSRDLGQDSRRWGTTLRAACRDAGSRSLLKRWADRWGVGVGSTDERTVDDLP